MTEEHDAKVTRKEKAVEQASDVQAPPKPIDGAQLLDEVRAWLARFLRTVSEEDLDLLAVWIVHTYLVTELYTRTRPLIDSPVPGSGKTTALEHIAHLAHRPVQMATVSSSSMLTRMLDAGMRTILIDETDRSLRQTKQPPARPGVRRSPCRPRDRPPRRHPRASAARSSTTR